MKQYEVVMPFTGIASRVIEAESEEEAKAKFMEESTMPNLTKTLITDVDIHDWEFTEKIVEGNVFYGIQNKVEVEELD